MPAVGASLAGGLQSPAPQEGPRWWPILPDLMCQLLHGHDYDVASRHGRPAGVQRVRPVLQTAPGELRADLSRVRRCACRWRRHRTSCRSWRCVVATRSARTAGSRRRRPGDGCPTDRQRATPAGCTSNCIRLVKDRAAVCIVLLYLGCPALLELS